jgi:hypothetical protein
MTAIIQPVVAGGGGGGEAPARNLRGSVASLPPSVTATIVSAVTADLKLRGFIVHGGTDCEAWVEVDGTPLPGLRARHNRALGAYLVLPNPESYSSPTLVVRLRVRNDGLTTDDFEGVLLGE